MFLNAKSIFAPLVCAVLLLGCAASPLERLITEVSASQHQLTLIDDVEEEQVPFQNAWLNAQASATEDLSTNEKIALVLAIRQRLLNQQVLFVDLRLEAQTVIPALREKIQLLKESETTLTEEEKSLLSPYVDDLKSARIALQGTRGLVQAKLVTLRGQYNLEHIDVVLATYQEVEIAMNTRVESLSTLLSIIATIDTMLISIIA
jgi:hypothetical protein